MPPTDVFERQVLDALPITVYTVDLEGRITSANRSWSRFAAANGAPHLADEDAVLGRSIFDAISDQAPREQIERAMALLRTGRAPMVAWEFPCDSPDTERVFLMQITPLRDGRRAARGAEDDWTAGAANGYDWTSDDAIDSKAGGGPRAPRPAPPVTGYVFSTVDITPSHKSREALIDTGIALSRTIALDRVFPEVVQQVRRAIGCDACVIAIADGDTAALRVAHQVGFDHPAAGAGREIERWIETELQPVWSEALANGHVTVAHSGHGLQLTAPMVSTEGALGAMTIVSDDIESPQRLREAERVLTTIAAQTAAAIERAGLVRRVEHKRRLEAVGEVAAGVAHELRNPLFGISSAAQLLRFRTREDPVVEKNVGRILREVERLNRMVTSLLDFGRPSAIHPRPGDPDAVWDEVIESYRGRLESRALQLHRVRAEPPARCAIDAEQLAQLFTNVLVNAVDAAPEASDLALASTTLPTGAWRCRLTNGGPAIPPDVLPRVFEIFVSARAGGTGIGLALCQRIVEEHRGTIGIESTPDAGTTVTITLPGA
ncbi:MAG: ATP-binding protein [Gemmatimonadaceae bacterium]